jgi:hypothetical protein
MVAALLASRAGFDPTGAEQIAVFAGSFVLGVLAVVLMWLRARRP